MKRSPVFLSETARQTLRACILTSNAPSARPWMTLQVTLSPVSSCNKELAELWSLPVARYRIIYQLGDASIIVVFIGPRRTVYERLRDLITKQEGPKS